MSTPDGARSALRPPRLRNAVGVWLGMVVLALLNATLRELFVAPAVGDDRAHVVSTLTLLVALAAVVALYFGRAREHTLRERVVVGVLWAGLTVAFEFGFGHYVAGEPWAALFEQYDVTTGHIWILVPLFVLVAPALAGGAGAE